MTNEIIIGTGITESKTVDPLKHNWDGQFDVLVIGLGAAGASAAIEAASQGAKVAIIDRFNGGGSTCLLYTSPSPRDS